MKNKSKILTISTVINIIIGIEVIIVCLTLIPRLLSAFDENNVAFSAMFAFLPQFSVIIMFIIMLVAFVFVALEILTAWISFKTNKTSWTIIHIILLIIVGFLGLFINVFQSSAISSLFLFVVFFAVIFRIVAYFDGKKFKT